MKREQFLRIIVTMVHVFIILIFCASSAFGEDEVWDCPACGRTGNVRNFCGSCGYPAPWTWEEQTGGNGTLIPSPAKTVQPTVASTAEPAQLTGYAKTIVDRAYVQSLPGAVGIILAELPEDTVVDVLGQTYVEQMVWHEVRYDGTETGYIRGNMLRMLSREEVISHQETLEHKNRLNFSWKAGDVITFGMYEQDNNLQNGPETIEWIVLDTQEGKALLLSKYGLDARPYHPEWEGMTWERCALREWLNEDFLNDAFSGKEKAYVLTTEVDNSSAQGYPGWKTEGGNDTQDQIFLLSYAEANRYLEVSYDYSGNLKSRVAPTTYAISLGANISVSYKTEDGSSAGWWWLRSPGSNENSAALALGDGQLNSYYVNKADGVIRPALWLDLNALSAD